MSNQGSRDSDDAGVEDGVRDVVEAVLIASRVLVAVSARSLTDLDDAVTPTQFRSLVILDGHGEINLNRLAEILDVNASTAMRTIDRLIANGFVTRQENPDNRRQVLLALTRAGTRLVARVTSRRRQEISRIVEAVPSAERAAVVHALRSFASASGELEPKPETTAVLGW
ncbi:MAG: MarR family transcriptional regulator [Jatrophihabitans sp.]